MGTISMSGKERRRLEVFGRVRSKQLTLVKASELLGLEIGIEKGPGVVG